MSAEARVRDLLALTQRLTETLSVEAAAFEAHRPAAVAAGAAESVRLANLYRQESARLARDPETLRRAPLALRQALIAATETFNAMVARHGRAVTAAKTVSEGLVQAIAREVAGARASPAGYGAAGRAGSAPSDKGRYTAVTLNRTA